jgi:putative ABC transport system permease protein
MQMMRQITGVGGRSDTTQTWTGTRFTVSNINDTTDQLETVIGTLNVVAFVIFLVLLVITAVGVTNSYRMVMMERTQEIGTMRAIGVKQRGIRWVFTLEALFVALIGTVGGLALSGMVTTVVGFIEWSASTALNAFLVRGHLRASISIFAIVRNVVAILIMAVWAVSAPAKSAARLEPAHALRTTY